MDIFYAIIVENVWGDLIRSGFVHYMLLLTHTM